MPGVILGQNISAMSARRQLDRASSMLTTSLQRLSSGQRINRASDDAAGLAIVSSLNASSRVFSQGIRNLNDGLSASAIAEGALGSLRDIAFRQLELAEQAANGTFNLTQRQVLNAEANKLVDEFNRITGSTRFNGLSLLDPSLGQVILQAGFGTSATLQMGLSDQLRRAVGNGTFQNPDQFEMGASSGPLSIETGDIDGDGKYDLVSANYAEHTVSVRLGNGNGTFEDAIIIDSHYNPMSLAIADVNGDGRKDIIAGTHDDAVVVSLQNANRTFGAATQVGDSNGHNYSMVTGDFNNDGKIDFATANQNNQTSVFLGNGNGTFKGAVFLSNAGDAQAISSADVNGDGILDIITADDNSSIGRPNGFSIFLGNGNGTFSGPRTFAGPIGTNAHAIGVGDFDNDGRIDFVSTSYGDSQAVIYLGNGNGSFRAAQTLDITRASSVRVADLNGDGISDLAISAQGLGDIYLGNGNGSFRASFSYNGSGSGFDDLAVGDFDGDGRDDLAFSRNSDTFLELLLAKGDFASTEKYLNINTRSGALDAIGTINATLARIQAQIGSIGATTSRFATAIGALQATNENYKAAASRISDIDVASESSKLVTAQILQQVSVAVLAQAKLGPQLALILLQQ